MEIGYSVSISIRSLLCASFCIYYYFHCCWLFRCLPCRRYCCRCWELENTFKRKIQGIREHQANRKTNYTFDLLFTNPDKFFCVSCFTRYAHTNTKLSWFKSLLIRSIPHNTFISIALHFLLFFFSLLPLNTIIIIFITICF